MKRPILDNQSAHRLFLNRHLLLRRLSGTGRGIDVDDVLHAVSFMRVDSVNAFARTREPILANRAAAGPTGIRFGRNVADVPHADEISIRPA